MTIYFKYPDSNPKLSLKANRTINIQINVTTIATRNVLNIEEKTAINDLKEGLFNTEYRMVSNNRTTAKTIGK